MKERASILNEAVEKEKRMEDFMEVFENGNAYVILQEATLDEAKIVCDRLVMKMEDVVKGSEISCSIATFPHDGETAMALMEKVTLTEPAI